MPVKVGKGIVICISRGKQLYEIGPTYFANSLPKSGTTFEPFIVSMV